MSAPPPVDARSGGGCGRAKSTRRGGSLRSSVRRAPARGRNRRISRRHAEAVARVVSGSAGRPARRPQPRRPAGSPQRSGSPCWRAVEGQARAHGLPDAPVLGAHRGWRACCGCCASSRSPTRRWPCCRRRRPWPPRGGRPGGCRSTAGRGWSRRSPRRPARTRPATAASTCCAPPAAPRARARPPARWPSPAGSPAAGSCRSTTRAGCARPTSRWRPVVHAATRSAAGAVLGLLERGAGGHCPPAACLHWGLRRGADLPRPAGPAGHRAGPAAAGAGRWTARRCRAGRRGGRPAGGRGPAGRPGPPVAALQPAPGRRRSPSGGAGTATGAVRTWARGRPRLRSAAPRRWSEQRRAGRRRAGGSRPARCRPAADSRTKPRPSQQVTATSTADCLTDPVLQRVGGLTEVAATPSGSGTSCMLDRRVTRQVGGATPSARATSSWPATASSTLCRRSRSRPSGSSTRSARGADSQAVGSSVPVSSKASGKPSASPHDATSGRSTGRQRAAACSTAVPRGGAAPLVQVADEEVGAEPLQVDGQHARGVRAVDEHGHAALLQRGDQRRPAAAGAPSAT